MEDNLKGLCVRHGVEPERVVFGGLVGTEEHIERLGCMDCFLDTPAYGSHTVGVDALWVGVPVLTMVREGGEDEKGEEVRMIENISYLSSIQR